MDVRKLQLETRREGRKERKCERKKENVWSESGPRVGEGNWAPCFRSNFESLTGQLLFGQRHFPGSIHSFHSRWNLVPALSSLCLILIIQAVLCSISRAISGVCVCVFAGTC